MLRENGTKGIKVNGAKRKGSFFFFTYLSVFFFWFSQIGDWKLHFLSNCVKSHACTHTIHSLYTPPRPLLPAFVSVSPQFRNHHARGTANGSCIFDVNPEGGISKRNGKSTVKGKGLRKVGSLISCIAPITNCLK